MKEIQTKVVVIGSGPAGYSAAFRCADLGLEVVLVERFKTLGGVCLNVGCIPSKALLHVAKVIEEAENVEHAGVHFEQPKIDLEAIDSYKSSVVKKLTNGLLGMAKMRKVTILQGSAKFIDAHSIEISDAGNQATEKVIFENAIIATGSRPVTLPFVPHDDPRVWDSTDALNVKEIPRKLLVMGGGIIGLEMGTVYEKLGSQVEIVEMFEQLIPVADADVMKIYTKENTQRFKIMLQTKVVAVEAKEEYIEVTFENLDHSKNTICYDAVLVAVGRVPNGHFLDVDKAGVSVDERGFIGVDKQMRTNIEHIFAVGDIVGQPMLAHKGVHEAHVAAEVIAGKKHYFDPKGIPSIAYTFPEVAWVGMTEKEAKEKDIPYEVSTFPWKASGRAIASDVSEGSTKLIFNKETNQLIGGALVGDNAGELLGEITLALEMDCDAEDLALTIHAHPTLHESIGMAAEIYEGSITDLPNAKAKK